MTLEQAIKKMEELSAALHKHVQRINDQEPSDLRDQMIATDMAIEAMKKAVSRAVYEYSGGWGYGEGKCPSCDTVVKLNNEKVFCDKCGQALSNRLSECVDTHCIACTRRGDEPDGSVCRYYAAKADEIMRIHEEG